MQAGAGNVRRMNVPEARRRDGDTLSTMPMISHDLKEIRPQGSQHQANPLILNAFWLRPLRNFAVALGSATPGLVPAHCATFPMEELRRKSS